MFSSLLECSAVSSSNDQLIGLLVLLSRLQTKSGLAPRCARTRTADTGLSFSTTVRMVVRVHYGTADCRTDTHVTLASSLTDVDLVVLSISYNSDSSSAI